VPHQNVKRFLGFIAELFSNCLSQMLKEGNAAIEAKKCGKVKALIFLNKKRSMSSILFILAVQ